MCSERETRRRRGKGGGTEEPQKRHGCTGHKALEKGAILSIGTSRRVGLALNADPQVAESLRPPHRAVV